ncbi:MAG: response regulator [Myxococcota bacterium]
MCMRSDSSKDRNASAPLSTGGGRVLVIDDEPMMGTTLRMALADQHDVVILRSGTEAHRLLTDDHDFDAVVCDLMMPDVSGMELHAWLSDRAPSLAQRMIFMTGGAYTDDARRFLERVGNPHMQKPFDVKDLLDLVEELRRR